MAKNDTIENRVYLFESLARALIERSAGALGSKNKQRRARVVRAMADLAYVSCAVSDTQALGAKAVRQKVLELLEGRGKD